jgi:hypothetical protein
MLRKLSTLSVLETVTARRDPVDVAAILAGLRQKFGPELDLHGVQLATHMDITPLLRQYRYDQRDPGEPAGKRHPIPQPPTRV